jgi:hypothetical protein
MRFWMKVMVWDPHTKNDDLLKGPTEFVDFPVSGFRMQNSSFRSYGFFDIGYLRITFLYAFT